MELRMLGPLDLVEGDRSIDLGAPKQRAVLAVLLIDSGRVVHTDRLIAAAWGDDPPPAASAGLQAYLSNLRRSLRDGATIDRRQPGYVLELGPATCDRDRFLATAAEAEDLVEDADWQPAAERARSALALWRGPALADLADEAWAAAAAHRLAERRADVREVLVTALLGAGRAAEAVAAAEALHDEQPLRERAAWLRMMALHRAGRTPEALEVHAEHGRRLSDELGLDVPPALRDLQVSILRGARELSDWPGASPASTAGPEAAGVPETARDFVGRRRELDVARRLLEPERRGVRWLVLSGPAGIGKTRLAEETLRLVETRGTRIVRTSCPEDDGTPAWWPVRQLLLSGPGADPEAVLTPPESSGADAARFAVYRRLEEALRDAPTAVLLDDLQWADRASLRWLTHLAQSGADLPLDVVATVREGVESEDLARFLAAVARRPSMRQVSLPPLETDEVAELASLVSGDAIEGAEAAVLAAQTGGNPFLVGEYARLPRAERSSGGVPIAVRSVLRLRLAGVDAEVLQVLRTAAVAGDELETDVLLAVTRLDREELADLLDEAAARELIVPTRSGAGYRFSHGLLRDEVLAGLSLPRRQRLHARIADALRGTGQHDLARRATHLLAALPLADPAEAHRACVAAARAAEDRYQSESAAEWWAHAARAYALLPSQDDAERDDLQIALVGALARAGRRQTVISVVEAALLEAVRNDRTASAGRLAAATLRTSGVWPWTSFTVDPGPLLTRLIGIEPLVRQDPGAHARVLAALAVGHYYDDDDEVPERLSLRAVEIAERLGDPEVLADALLGRMLVLCGVSSRAEEEVGIAARLRALPHRLAGLDSVLCDDLLTLVRMTLGDVDGAERALRAGITGSDAMRLPIVRVQLRWMETNLASWHGDIEASERFAAQAEALHAQTELYVMSVGRFSGITRAWERGRLGEMAVEMTAIPDLPWLRAAQLLAEERIDEGAAALRAALASSGREVWTTLGEMTLAALLVAERGLREFAAPLRTRLGPFAGLVAAFGQTGHVGLVALALAELARLDGADGEARDLLAAARVVARRGRGAPALLRCRLLEAELDDAAPEVFAAIAAEAEAMGLGLVAGRARERATALTRAAASRPDRAPAAPPPRRGTGTGSASAASGS